MRHAVGFIDGVDLRRVGISTRHYSSTGCTVYIPFTAAVTVHKQNPRCLAGVVSLFWEWNDDTAVDCARFVFGAGSLA